MGKRSFLPLGILFSVTLLFFSCYKQDIDDLKNRQDLLEDEIRKHEERLQTLEKQIGVINGRISDIQALLSASADQDFITDVVSVWENGIEVGYTITFSIRPPVTIYHGAAGQNGKDGADGKDGENGKDGIDGQNGKDGENGKDGIDGQNGADGKNALIPTITLKLFNGEYYWAQLLPGGVVEFILDEQGNIIKAIDVSGKSAFEIAQQYGYSGTIEQWLESLKGDSAYRLACENGFTGTEEQWLQTLNGIPPVVGIKKDVDGEYYWTCTVNGGQEQFILDNQGNKIRATGENGAPGSGFAENGVDLSNPEYVIFTMADGVTTFAIPRISAIKITFGTFESFIPGGMPQSINFQVTGGSLPVRLKVIDKPDNWIVGIDHQSRTITADPRMFGGENGQESITVLASTGESNVILYEVPLTVLSPEPGTVFYENGIASGVVIRRKMGSTAADRGLIIHTNDAPEENVKWSQDRFTAGTWDYRQEIIPAAGKTDYGEAYIQSVRNMGEQWHVKYPVFNWCTALGEGWFIPTVDDLTVAMDMFDFLNLMLDQFPGGSKLLLDTPYWTCDNIYGYAQGLRLNRYLGGHQTLTNLTMLKSQLRNVRAFRAF